VVEAPPSTGISRTWLFSCYSHRVTSSGLPQLLPGEIRWAPGSPGEAETKEFFFGADTPLKIRAPWWLHAEAQAGRLKLRPKVCGAFSGELAVCIGRDWHLTRVASAVRAAAENRWAGAAMALTSALPGAAIIYLLAPLTMMWPIGLFVALFAVGVAPLVMAAVWSARLAGPRFLLRATLAWIATVAVFSAFVYCLSRMDLPGSSIFFSKGVSARHFLLLGAPGAVAGIIGAWCLAPGQLRLPGLAAGLLYPASAIFATHWVEVARMGPLTGSVLFGTALILPLLLLAPWTGSRLPPAKVAPGSSQKRIAIGLATVFGCVLLALGLGYQQQKPAAVSVTRKPLNARVTGGAGETVWELPMKYPARKIVTTPGSSAVYVLGSDILKIEPDRNSFLEIRTRALPHLSGGKNDIVYFSSLGVLFAFRNDKVLWSRGSTDTWFDVTADPDGNVIAIGDGQLMSLTMDGKERWRYPENPRAFHFICGVTDAAGNVYVVTISNEIFAFDSQRRLRWNKPLQIRFDPFKHPEQMCSMTSSPALLVVGSDGGAIAFDPAGEVQFVSPQPFRLFRCDENFAYGSDQKAIHRIDRAGGRQVLYTSPDPLVGRVLAGAADRIYALTAGKVAVLKLNGEVETSFPVSGKVVSLIGVAGDQIIGITASSVLALKKSP
jgi:hypothetical protein